MMDRYDKKRPELVADVLKKIKEQNIKYIWLQFTDLVGTLKSFGVASNRMPEILESGASFDGSSISGFGRTEESDQVAVPDPTTFAEIPWRTTEHNVARFICDVYTPDDKRYDGDPRYILQKASKKIADAGYTFKCAPEMEFFWLKPGGEGAPTESDFRGYFDADPADENQLMRREVATYAENFGIEIETMHHEVAKSQHEIDIKYGPACELADNAVTLKSLVKIVGKRHGYVGTFMPKPFFGHNGSGMHVHQSLWKGNTNCFYDENDVNKISQTMRSFIAGELKYAKEFCAITNSWPNSFKRLVPGYEAPTFIAWGFKNRSMLIRVPNFLKNPSKAARCEIRCPDPAGNVYLQIAALMTAGFEGVKNKLEATAPVELNIFHADKCEQDRLGIENLPRDLGDALDHFEKSKLMKELMGETAFNAYLALKREEFRLYSAQISDWELKRYTPFL